MVLACGSADVPRRLQIVGEELDFVTHRPPIHRQARFVPCVHCVAGPHGKAGPLAGRRCWALGGGCHPSCPSSACLGDPCATRHSDHSEDIVIISRIYIEYMKKYHESDPKLRFRGRATGTKIGKMCLGELPWPKTARFGQGGGTMYRDEEWLAQLMSGAVSDPRYTAKAHGF